ncbi:uncharacterized protein LOC110701185 isoform X2 [Chenopodium quinoa]|uniref:DUF3615 domain-containing protein n=1 Tax=Chenopodium quinoa TaxID=63459 RepID=A0A803L4H3_CHEQI|nr:uncharacterized protein LOC110701185 isoform X2 [Chenopodium quinoa]
MDPSILEDLLADDSALTDYFAMLDKLEKEDSWYIPDRLELYPGRTDCYKPISEADVQIEVAEYSEKALAYFNKTYDTDYKYESNGGIVYGDQDHCYATHCSFTAKPDTVPLTPGDFSSKLFFAEFMLSDADYKNRCKMCPMGVICHPKTFQDGYKLPLD